MLTWCGVPYNTQGFQSNGKPSDVAILGAPLDAFSSRHSGQAGAPGAIRRYEAFESWADPYRENLDIRSIVKVVDCGDIDPMPQHPVSAYRDLALRVKTVSENTGTLITLGGDHTVSAYVLDGLHDAGNKPIALVHFDAHTDTWADHYTTKVEEIPHHASWVRWVLDENYVDVVHQYGVRALGPPDDKQLISGKKVHRYGSDGMQAPYHAIRELHKLKDTHRFYISIDVDVCDPAFAPGVAYREPGGWTSAELVQGLEVLSTLDPIGVDIVECIPNRDRDELTVGLAHRLVLSVIKGRYISRLANVSFKQ